MHLQNLCENCLEFGDCMGVFYEPFVITTALSILFGKQVNWKPFSEHMPELLVADTGPAYEEYQVCLQPHVYMDPRQQVPGNERNPWQPERVRDQPIGAPLRGRGGPATSLPTPAPHGRSDPRSPAVATSRPELAAHSRARRCTRATGGAGSR